MAEVIVSERKTYQVVDVLDASVDSVHTVGVELMGRPILGLLVPAVSGSGPEVTVEVNAAGTSWLALLEADAATEAITLTAMGTAYAVSSDELTPLAAYCGGEHSGVRVRLAVSVEQTADRVFTWIVCG